MITEYPITLRYNRLILTLNHYHLAPFGTIRHHSVSFGTIRHHSVPFDTIRYHSVPFGTIRYHSVPFGTIGYHSATFGPILNTSVPFSTIRYHSAPFGTIRYHLVPFWYSAWVAIGHHKGITRALGTMVFNKGCVEGCDAEYQIGHHKASFLIFSVATQISKNPKKVCFRNFLTMAACCTICFY